MLPSLKMYLVSDTSVVTDEEKATKTHSFSFFLQVSFLLTRVKVIVNVRDKFCSVFEVMLPIG